MGEPGQIKKFRKHHLNQGEVITAWAEGYIGEIMGKGDKSQHNGVLLLTSERVVFYRKTIFGEVFQTIPLDAITSTQRKSFLGHKTINIFSQNYSLSFKSFSKGPKIEALVSAIEAGKNAYLLKKSPPYEVSKLPLSQKPFKKGKKPWFENMGCFSSLVVVVFLFFMISALSSGLFSNKEKTGSQDQTSNREFTTVTSRKSQKQPLKKRVENPKKSLQQSKKSNVTKIPYYRIIDKDDFSFSNCVRFGYRVEVKKILSEAEFLAISNKIINDQKKGRAFNAISVSFYLPNTDFEGAYTAGQIEWVPYGDWGKADSIRTGDYSKHKYNIKISKEIDVDSGELFGLTVQNRRKIFLELLEAEDKAFKVADSKYPVNVGQSLQNGQKLTLTKKTALMPELNPANPMEAINKMKYIQPGQSIEVVRTSQKSGTPWYYVKTSRDGYGWINSLALIGQFQAIAEQNLIKKAEFEQKLMDETKSELCKKYTLTKSQIDKIIIEGVKKGW